ncbi:MAG TPA: hypothetical protein VGF67_20270 [Ktedonobacteraceae bacterium]|jgi:serine/threonine protein kinase
MPERLAYDDAMRFANIRLQIQDPEIKQGRVETITVPTNLGSFVQPWGVEGGFAVVYKYRTRSGQFRALRCFRRDMDADTQFRYERIGPYFQTHASQVTAGFKYHAQGILIKESSQPQGRIYPVIEMDWIEGTTLLDTVDELCQQRDRAELQELSQRWLTLLKTMRQAHISHGDLAGLNVMVRPDGSLVLIDYDGVYIPDFGAHQLPQVLLGQPDYQHPQMGKRPFNEQTDAFSALVIYTALLALSWKPELWDRYASRGANQKLLDTNLLLKQADFQEPLGSALFQELEQCSDPQIKSCIQELKRACLQPIGQIHFPFQLIDPDYPKKQALEQLAVAIQAENDAQIAAAWTPAMEQFAPAQAYRPRALLARQRLSALQQWRVVVQHQKIAQIVDQYNLLLDACSEVTADEKQILRIARDFAQACQHNDERALIALYNTIRQQRLPLTFTAQEKQRVEHARQRQQHLRLFADALQERNLDALAQAYQALPPELLKQLPVAQRRAGELAEAFLQACQRNSDPAVLAAYEDLLRAKVALSLQPAQLARVQLARECEQARKVASNALTSGNLRLAASAYHPLLEQSTEFKGQELDLLNAIRKFILMYDRDHDQRLLEAYQDLKRLHVEALFTFTPEERARLDLASRRQQALQTWRTALRAGEPRQIVARYDRQLLDRRLSSEEQEILSLAQQFVGQNGNDEQFLAVYRDLMRSPYGNRFMFKPEDRQRAETIERYERQITDFATHLEQSDALAIVEAYRCLPTAISDHLTHQQEQRVKLAQQALEMRAQLRQAILTKDDPRIREVYKPYLLQRFPGLLSKQERNEAESALKIPQIKEKLYEHNYRQMLKLAAEIQREGGLKEQGPRLRQAMRRLMSETSVTGGSACIQERGRRGSNLLQVQWQWPADELIKYAWVFWDATRQPHVPNPLRIAKTRSASPPPGNYQVIMRRGNEKHGHTEIDIHMLKYIYTKVCIAMYDEWDTQAEVETWCFSPAAEFVAHMCEGSQK